ncbi:hypothetical protein [Haloarcula argentinensis]|uniref:Uncharacterized protein n=1 Tax=Haloarcula argentinensis TaxID=43776 RepID=A0A830FXJ3_HALAR|nr:hypothetical protein [Haloarcula argentinensis]GGM52526.1 hypothetical protein GCM10009006_37050 [Haloarcula argentinensis]
MASSPDKMTRLFEQLDGPYRTRLGIQLISGSARTTIPADIRDDVGITLDQEGFDVDAFWFEEHQKLVIDLEGAGDGGE